MDARHGILNAPLGLALAVMLLVGLAGAVWACTPQPEQFALDTAAASRGEPVTVSGKTVPLSEVAIRWNSLDGPVLATVDTRTGEFSETIEVPADAEPGVAYVIAEPEGNGGIARAAFEVTGGESATTPSESAWNLAQDPTMTDTSASPAGMTAPVAAGAGMLSLGLVGLLGGATVATVQQRRVPVPARRS